MVGDKIGLDVIVATPEINGKIDAMYVYDGVAGEYKIIKTTEAYIPMPPYWEERIGPHEDNLIPQMTGTNTGDESLYLSGEIVITSPDGTSTTITMQESELLSPGTTRDLVVPNFPEDAFVIGTTVGTYKCEAKLYGRRTLTDTKTLLDTDIFYVHNYTEAIDIPAPTTADYEYRTAETLDALGTASWSPVGASLVINPNWWLQFRFNITNNGDEPVNIHIREVQDSKSRIAMTVTDPTAATSLLPVYMKQVAPGTSKKIETLAIQLTKSGSWHFEGYVYAQRAYNRILDVNQDGTIHSVDVVLLWDVVLGKLDNDNDGYMTDSDIRANNLAVKPFWTHYAYTNMDHVTPFDGELLMNAVTEFMPEEELRTPPEDAFILQYDPFIIHAYGRYSYYNGSSHVTTTNEDEAKANAASGYKALRIEDGKLVTFSPVQKRF